MLMFVLLCACVSLFCLAFIGLILGQGQFTGVMFILLVIAIGATVITYLKDTML